MPIALHLAWRHVLFANWPIDPNRLAPHIPNALTLDTYEGQAWVSIVALNNVDVRSRYVPSFLGITAPGVNLRTYVTSNERDGVFFFSLDADSVLTVLGARILHRLPYYHADVTITEHEDMVHFDSQRRHPGARSARFKAGYEPLGDRFRAKPGSLHAFLFERYRTFTQTPKGTLRYTEVQHKPWPLLEANVKIKENTLLEAAGIPQPRDQAHHLCSPGLDAIVPRMKRTDEAPG